MSPKKLILAIAILCLCILGTVSPTYTQSLQAYLHDNDGSPTNAFAFSLNNLDRNDPLCSYHISDTGEEEFVIPNLPIKGKVKCNIISQRGLIMKFLIKKEVTTKRAEYTRTRWEKVGQGKLTLKESTWAFQSTEAKKNSDWVGILEYEFIDSTLSTTSTLTLYPSKKSYSRVGKIKF